MTRVIALLAPAKINIALEVLRKRADGYHDIRSVFVRLPKLADRIALRIDPGATAVRISTQSKDIPIDATNICHQAATRYLAQIDERAAVQIDIDKKIPVAAGLGGGSSDAAATLLALNRHFGDRMRAPQLAKLGSAIGKDIAFFLRGDASSHVSGAGETVRAIGNFPRAHFLLVNPRIAVPTRDAYQALDDELWYMCSKLRSDRCAIMRKAIKAHDIAKIAAALYNDFEATIGRMHPIVSELKHVLLAFGARGALMSGSGPTVFGLFDSPRAVRNAEQALRERYTRFFIAAA